MALVISTNHIITERQFSSISFGDLATDHIFRHGTGDTIQRTSATGRRCQYTATTDTYIDTSTHATDMFIQKIEEFREPTTSTHQLVEELMPTLTRLDRLLQEMWL